MKDSLPSGITRLSRYSLLVAYALFILIFGISFYLYISAYNIYYLLVQEDGLLEWASFWSFFIAGILFSVKAFRQYRINGLRWAWFAISVSLFCFLVAMEEISWGQRLIGYQPPEYFLENNYQQELNLHNIVDTNYRKIAVITIILGYGVILPFIGFFSRSANFFQRLGIFSSPVLLAPAFFGMFLLFVIYPFRFTGEIVELLLGLGFMLAALAKFYPATDAQDLNEPADLKPVMLSVGWVIFLSIGNVLLTQFIYQDDPKKVEVAKEEVLALQLDFVSLVAGKYGKKIPTCGKHMRIYSYFEGYHEIRDLATVQFRSLQDKGLSEERATFFIDPWNMPYWIKDFCTPDGKRMISVYSFGPDRMRQSNNQEIQGDDVGLVNLIDL